MIKLLDGVSEDTTGEAVRFQAGDKRVYIDADDFGGGTVIFEILRPDTSDRWVPLNNASFTSNVSEIFKMPENGVRLRASLSGSTSPSNVTVGVDG